MALEQCETYEISEQFSEAPDEWNRITGAIIGSAIEFHKALGSGLLERRYEHAMVHELRIRGVEVACQLPVRIMYKSIELGDQVLDLVVGGIVVVELKSIERVHDVHLNQLVSYMRSGRFPLGLLINFNVARVKDGLHRRILSPQTPTPLPFVS